MKVAALGQALIHEPVAWPAALRDLVRNADCVVCNFEGCLPANGSWPMKSRTVHAAHPDALDMLRDLGVTHLALANNHAWDYGHAGILETRRRAEAAGFAVAGAGIDLAAAMAPAIVNGVALIAVDAGPTPDWAIADTSPGVAPLRLGMQLGLPAPDIARLRQIAEETGETTRRRKRAAVGFDGPFDGAMFYGRNLIRSDTPCEIWTPDPADLDRLVEAVRTAATSGALVLVALHYHHWSTDWHRPPHWLAGVAATIRDAGAAAMLCTGPPLAYPPVLSGSTAFAPSLGNLVFHTRRAATYDALDLPVGRGMALVLENDIWTSHPIDAQMPSAVGR